MDFRGLALCAVSAIMFGTTGVVSELADRAGVALAMLLAGRFSLAALALLATAAATGRARELTRRPSLGPFLFGLVIASIQTAMLLAAILRLGPALAVLLHYAYPGVVAVVAVAFGRERARGRLALVVALATAGVALVLAGRGVGSLDGVGVACGLGSAVLYALWVLAATPLGRAISPLTTGALVCSGMAIAFVAATVATGADADVGAAGWGWLVTLAVVSTSVPVVAFLAGLARVGATAGSIVSTAEPVATVVLAWAVLGQTLTPVQAAGAALVVAGVVELARSAATARPEDGRVGSRAAASGPAA